MRTLTTQESKVLGGGRFNTPVRLRVKDAGGTWQDLTALFGRDWVRSWEVDEDVDQPVAQLRCSLAREIYFDSLSALRTNTRPNLTTGSYAPLLSGGAEVDFAVAVLPEGIAPVSGDWRTIFQGFIDRVELASNPMSFTARDQGGEDQDLFIQADKDYGSGGGTAMQTVIQSIVKDARGAAYQVGKAYVAASGTVHGDRVTPTTHNGFWYRVTTGGTAGAEPSWPTTIGATVTSGATFTCAGVVPTLYVPTSPGFNVTTYTQQPQSVLEAVRSMALNLIGWDLRRRWRDASSQFELTLWVPDRATTTVLYTWDPDHYYAVPEFSIDRSTVRNQVDVVYSDAADLDAAGVPKRKTRSKQDKDSMDKWSRGLPRWMQLAEDATSQIDTSGEADTLAANALSDLKDPKAIAAYDLPLFPFAQLGDLYRFSADGVLYNADQDLAVTGIRHSGSAGGAARTTVRVTGRPVVAVEQWLRIEAGEVVPALFVGPAAPTGVTLTQVQGGLSVKWTRATTGPWAADFEVHASTSSSFTPSSSTLKGTTDATAKTLGDLGPGVTYYIQVVGRTRDGSRGTASSEVSTAAGYTPPRAMTPSVAYNRLPFNNSFEAQTDTNAPPDTWSEAAGTWGSGMSMESTIVFMGGKSVHFVGASKKLRSQLFPVPPYLCHVTALIRTANSGVAYLAIELYDSSQSILVTAAATGSSAGAFAPLAAFTAGSGSAAYAAIVVGSDASNPSNGDVYVDGAQVVLPGEGFTSPTYGTGWGTVSGSPGFRRNEGGEVTSRGKIQQTASTANTTLFTYPVGYRPGQAMTFRLPYQGAAGDVEVDVNTNGTVVINSAFALNNWVSLAGISFLAEG